MRGTIKSFKKDQGFGTLTADDGAEYPFDYEVCARFGDHPKEGDIVEVETGTSRLGRPKSTKVTFIGKPVGGAPAVDPNVAIAAQIEKDLSEYTRRGLFAGVDAKWIATHGLGETDRLTAVALWYLKDAPTVRTSLHPSNPEEVARALVALFPELALHSVAPDGEKWRLTLTPHGAGPVTSAVTVPVGVMLLVNHVLARWPEFFERLMVVGDDRSKEMIFVRAQPIPLAEADPERILPIWWHWRG